MTPAGVIVAMAIGFVAARLVIHLLWWLLR
jgi:hypothetical protein